MSKTGRRWSIELIREIQKHASKDDCYKCKQLLRERGLKPDKEFPSPTE